MRAAAPGHTVDGVQINAIASASLALVGVAPSSCTPAPGPGRRWRGYSASAPVCTRAYLALIPYTALTIRTVALLARIVLAGTFSHPPANTTLHTYAAVTLGLRRSPLPAPTSSSWLAGRPAGCHKTSLQAD